jgi:hypothetical protein
VFSWIHPKERERRSRKEALDKIAYYLSPQKIKETCGKVASFHVSAYLYTPHFLMIPLDVNISFHPVRRRGRKEGGENRGRRWYVGEKRKRWGRSRGRGMGGEDVKVGGVWV